MSRRARLGLLWALLGAAILAAVLAPPIPQDPAYHRFADTRVIWGIPNALNILSNVGFVLVGALGLWAVWPGRSDGPVHFQSAGGLWPYLVLFGGFALRAWLGLLPSRSRQRDVVLGPSAAGGHAHGAVIGYDRGAGQREGGTHPPGAVGPDRDRERA